jgi:hypothetical protein
MPKLRYRNTMEGAMSPLVLMVGVVMASAEPMGLSAQNATPLMQHGPLLVQGADCYAVGEQKASELGGALASADDAVQNGNAVCRIIVVVPAQNGERAKRVELIVPKG